MDYEQLVEKYVKLRDKKAEMKAAYEKEVAGIETLLERVEGKILEYLNESGIESIRTKAGTAFKATKSSATVADWDSFFAFVMETENYQMLEHRASKTAVVEYKEENGDLPPGLNWSEMVSVQIRRA